VAPDLFIAQVIIGFARLGAHSRACSLAKVVPSLLRLGKCAKSARRSQRRNDRNCRVGNHIGEYFDYARVKKWGLGLRFPHSLLASSIVQNAQFGRCYSCNLHGLGVLTCTMKPIQNTLRSSLTASYMNRRSIGPRLAKREQ
jgi:hypothetical protein